MTHPVAPYPPFPVCNGVNLGTVKFGVDVTAVPASTLEAAKAAFDLLIAAGEPVAAWAYLFSHTCGEALVTAIEHVINPAWTDIKTAWQPFFDLQNEFANKGFGAGSYTAAFAKHGITVPVYKHPHHA